MYIVPVYLEIKIKQFLEVENYYENTAVITVARQDRQWKLKLMHKKKQDICRDWNHLAQECINNNSSSKSKAAASQRRYQAATTLTHVIKKHHQN